MRNQYSDEDSDYTEDETLIMLNFPQLNCDEAKLKLLNAVRGKEKKQEKTKSVKLNLEEMSRDEASGEESSEGNPRKRQHVDVINSAKSFNSVIAEKLGNVQNTTNDKELKKNYGRTNINDEQQEENNSNENNNINKTKEGCEKESEMEMEVNKHAQINEGNGKYKNTKEHKEKEKGKEEKNETCQFPIEINSICLENIFSDIPKCIINKKYRFTGMHTASIGTNLFFKEPESMNKKSDSDNEDILSDDFFQENVTYEEIMSKEDFAVYEGHSTKIISFEIDY